MMSVPFKEIVAVIGKLEGKTQSTIAKQLGITQPAVQQRLSNAQWWAVAVAVQRWEKLAGQLTSKT